jgi:hypothetical protein
LGGRSFSVVCLVSTSGQATNGDGLPHAVLVQYPFISWTHHQPQYSETTFPAVSYFDKGIFAFTTEIRFDTLFHDPVRPRSGRQLIVCNVSDAAKKEQPAPIVRMEN